MKKTVFTKILFSSIILGLFAFSSCKKDGGSSPQGFYVKFKLDGADKQYSEIASAVFNTALPLYQCTMIAEKQVNGTVYEGMGITINSNASIAPNVTYTEETVPGIGAPQVSFLFTDANGAQASSAFSIAPNIKVVITQLDDKTITGTFSGNIVSTTDFTTSETITQGTFHLPRM